MSVGRERPARRARRGGGCELVRRHETFAPVAHGAARRLQLAGVEQPVRVGRRGERARCARARSRRTTGAGCGSRRRARSARRSPRRPPRRLAYGAGEHADRAAAAGPRCAASRRGRPRAPRRCGRRARRPRPRRGSRCSGRPSAATRSGGCSEIMLIFIVACGALADVLDPAAGALDERGRRLDGRDVEDGAQARPARRDAPGRRAARRRGSAGRPRPGAASARARANGADRPRAPARRCRSWRRTPRQSCSGSSATVARAMMPAVP